MADRFELSYIYARSCGSLKRSWGGPRSAELIKLGRLSDVWRALFKDASPALPENSLLEAIEQRVVKESLDDFTKLAASLRTDEDFFIALRRKVEFARVKRVLLAVRDAEAHCPQSDDPDLPEGFDSSAYPRLEAMFARSRYSWIGKATLDDLPAAENRLDRQFYTELWQSLSSVPARRRDGIKSLLALEIELENVVWALRLSRYYAMAPEIISGLLVRVPGFDVTSAALAGASRKLDRRSDWEGWKYEFLITKAGEPWSLDVPALEIEARRYLYRKLRHALHLNPFTYTPLYCFYKIKEYEVAVLLGVIEGIHLGAPPEEIAAFALAGGGQ